MEPIKVDSLRNSVPAIFATHPSPKRSDKYSFVPTIKMLEDFEREGWGVFSAKQSGRGQYATHEVRLRNLKMPNVGDCISEAIITNSHNGLKKFSFGAGLHRFVCSNGLTVPLTESEQFTVRHKDFDFGEIRRLTDQFAEHLPRIGESVGKMSQKILTDPEKISFARQAIALRWREGKRPMTLPLSQLIAPERREDVGNDMWRTFNVVQEKLVKGGLEYRGNKDRRGSVRGLRGIEATNNFNTKLWELAESYS